MTAPAPLMLVPYVETLDIQPAVFHEKEAGEYISVCRTKFRELVKAGLIPFAEHVNGVTRIYRRSDLDAYLDGLNWRKMEERKVSPLALVPRGVDE